VPQQLDEMVESYLRALEPDELVRRLLALAERDEVASTALRAEAAAATGTFDLAAFRKELTARLRVSGFVDRRRAGTYAQWAHAVLDVLEQLLAAGRPDDVLVCAEHVMARLDTAMSRIDDSSGYLGAVVSRVQDLHHAACVAARPDPRRLGGRLVEFELKTNWEWFLDAPERYREVLGEEGLASYRTRLEREWQTLPQLHPEQERTFPRSFDGRRATITFLRESLARAEGSVDELVSVLARDLSSPFHFCKIADVLEQAGREREALAWLERGISAFPPAGDAQLRSRAVRAYLRDGQMQDAVALAQRAFDAEPSARTYAELREATSGFHQTDALREAALDRLRALNDRAGRSQAVRAQLGEGDVEGAWHDAEEGGCTLDLWRKLADTRGATHPAEAVPVYRRLLERALEHSNVGAYEEAIDLLRALEDALARADRNAEFDAELNRLRTQQRRRPKLLSMLAAQGW
jgi:tetratricopeptide (TPR) repeat protein